ncbi:hypothetical protein LSH36_252g02029 [Paralvinella palmiformis]|uniref:Uncharacterized protein n=1 Tax=Paralvinella palmiformis TaxID=53620 RepID=A0AAD9N4C9_9ANNE|nr:hypothetical protein LSH36_252g02029 [Paralvinella palmiformis]
MNPSGGVQPTPRRSLRKRTQPNWMASGEFVYAQLATIDESTDNTSVLHILLIFSSISKRRLLVR